MLDRGVVGINKSSSMSLEEANLTIRVIQKFTKTTSQRVDQLINQLEALGPSQREKTAFIENEVNELIEYWNLKVRKLGAVPKGLWFVDIDSGDGYYCWKFPEPEVLYWHDYESGFVGRVPIEEKLNAKSLNHESSTSPNKSNAWRF